jgi:hypothetical protein
VLVIIGPSWLQLLNERLEDPRDWVRYEIAESLKRRWLPVVPVCRAGVEMPRPHQLPEELRDLGWRDGVILDPFQDFDSHLTRLLGDVERVIEAMRKEKEELQNIAAKRAAAKAEIDRAEPAAQKAHDVRASRLDLNPLPKATSTPALVSVTPKGGTSAAAPSRAVNSLSSSGVAVQRGPVTPNKPASVKPTKLPASPSTAQAERSQALPIPRPLNLQTPAAHALPSRRSGRAVARSPQERNYRKTTYATAVALCLAVGLAVVLAIFSGQSNNPPEEISFEVSSSSPQPRLAFELPALIDYNPDRRDPFRSLLAAPEEREIRGSRPSGIPGLLIDEIDLVGIFRTARGFVAQVSSDTQKKAYLLKEGDQLYDGNVVSITRNEVVFKQVGQDPTAVKPFREVVKSLGPP